MFLNILVHYEVGTSNDAEGTYDGAMFRLG